MNTSRLILAIEYKLDKLNEIIGRHYWRKGPAAHRLVLKLESYREDLHRELQDLNSSDWDECHAYPWKI